ncbi:MAG: hypothetical protein QXP02_00260 [Desulfurococcaceae archaeon]
MKVHVALDVYALHRKLILSGKVFIKIDDLARDLSISTKSAGKILSKMVEKGLATRWSKNTYQLLIN